MKSTPDPMQSLLLRFLCTLTAFFVFTSFSALSARDFLPQRWFENVPATDTSVQQSLVFQTVPGVVYTVQSSHDLVNWQDDPPVYGLGQQHVVPMREFTPPPAPSPHPPASPPALPSYSYVSLVLRSTSGAAGGTVVSWRSLDDGTAKTVLITGELHQDWNVTPLYAGLFGSYWFFVVCAPGETAPPAENSLLGALDTAMLATLETNLSAMNAEVAASAALARLTPDPAPPNPNVRKFWRILVNAAVDSDSDGTPDWAEFELAAQGPDANGLIGDPFNADTDGNGVRDGFQLDSDGDSVPDALDSAPADATVTSEIIPLPRYAVFPLAGFTPGEGVVTSPSMVNDQGTVLYVNGTWSGGSWTPLVKGKIYDGVDANETPPYGMAMFLNDSGVIVGRDGVSLSGGDVSSGGFYWPSPGSNPAELSFTSGLMKSYPLTPGRLSHDGRFFAPRVQWDTDLNSPGPPLGNHLWNIAGGAPAAAPHGSLGSYVDSALSWGVTEEGKGLVYAPTVLPELSFAPKNVVRVGSGSAQRMVALSENGQASVWDGTAWQDSPTYQQAIDLAEDGTAIGRAHDGLPAPVLLNGKWTAWNRAAPSPPELWQGFVFRHMDTSKSGWILSRQESVNAPVYSLSLPLRLSGSYTNSQNETVTEAVGVDDFSITTLDNGSTVDYRIWVMAPKGGGAKTVKFKAPLSTVSPLTLEAEGITFNSGSTVTLYQPETAVQIEAGTSTTSGDEILLDLKLGTTTSDSHLVGFKVMKARVVKVNVYQVTQLRPPASPVVPDAAIMPTEAELEEYLNDLYKPQINVTFDVNLVPAPLEVAWDTNNDMVLNPSNEDDEYSADQEEIISAVPQNDGSNIQVFLMGIDWLIGNDHGTTNRPNRTCWIKGNQTGDKANKEFIQHTIAHEIGHVFFDYGHPDKNGGHARLPLTDHVRRLMADGTISIPDKSRLTVKGEWDVAETWLNSNIPNEE